MKTKEKKCKGTGKAKNYGFGELTVFRKYGLCNTCYRDWLLTSDEGAKVLSKHVMYSKKRVEKEERRKNNEKKKTIKTYRSLIIDAKKPFQKLIRIRDHGKTCISCEKPLPFNIGEYDAGHFYKAELYSGLIFDPINVAGQCVRCNQHEHGNESGYAKGIVRVYGKDVKEMLDEKAVRTKNHKWDRQQLIDMKKHYLLELKKIENQLITKEEIDFSVGILK